MESKHLSVSVLVNIHKEFTMEKNVARIMMDVLMK